MTRDDAIQAFVDEHTNARLTWPEFHSAHEGFAVLREEVDELWDLVKSDGPPSDMAAECVQIGAMALAFILECCGDS